MLFRSDTIMNAKFSRRTLFAFASAVAAMTAGVKTASASPASVPPIWNGEKMYNSFLKDGTGFSFPHKEGAPVAVVAFDTQCPDCMRLLQRLQPLLKDVQVNFYPISFMNIHSEPQGTTILMADKPYEVFERQHEHFKDPDFRGIRYDISKLPVELRDKVWTNTKLHRRAGCRAVPYGVFKNSKGEYVPFDENLTTEELRKVFELN